ncbi:MAG: hypothetical protein ACYTE8_08605 [Planctomycetota bacterium]
MRLRFEGVGSLGIGVSASKARMEQDFLPGVCFERCFKMGSADGGR